MQSHARARGPWSGLRIARRAATTVEAAERGRARRAEWRREQAAVQLLQRRVRGHAELARWRKLRAAVLLMQAGARRRAATRRRWALWLSARAERMHAIELGMHMPPPSDGLGGGGGASVHGDESCPRSDPGSRRPEGEGPVRGGGGCNPVLELASAREQNWRGEARAHVAHAWELWQELHAPLPPWHEASGTKVQVERQNVAAAQQQRRR